MCVWDGGLGKVKVDNGFYSSLGSAYLEQALIGSALNEKSRKCGG